MSFAPRLDLRQSQSLIMTPQLQQAIKLLTLSNLEIETFINEAVESNPLLQIEEFSEDGASGHEPTINENTREDIASDELMRRQQGEADASLDIPTEVFERGSDTGDWSAGYSFSGEETLEGLEHRAETAPGLLQHLEAQIGAATSDPQQLLIARYIIGLLDDAGYLTTPIDEIASNFGVGRREAELALRIVQTLEPTGVGARTLAECLMLQAQEADRYDPCMALLIDNLDLLANGRISQVQRRCNVSDDDFADMLAELQSYDPKPGMRFGYGDSKVVVPDVLIASESDGDWQITINEATLPRLVVNRTYYLELRDGHMDNEAYGWLRERLTDANWLVRALDQRRKTILEVVAEIAQQQKDFFRYGVAHLRPMTLRAIAEATDLHESTISRVTSNKYLQCSRGTFELKYFFTSGVAATDGDEAVSAEAVKAQIRTLITAERPDMVLSDDKLVELLRQCGYNLARRTVAKYREAIGIGSSVQRRRQKKLARAA